MKSGSMSSYRAAGALGPQEPQGESPISVKEQLESLRRGAHPQSSAGQLYTLACTLLSQRESQEVELRRIQRQRDRLQSALAQILMSATPTEKENPAMAAAWNIGHQALQADGSEE